MNKGTDEIGNNLLCLLHHPSEPIFLPKNNLYFDIPSDFVEDVYRQHLRTIYVGIQNRFRVKRVEIRNDIARALLPSDFMMQLRELRKNKRFSQFIPRHRELATLLINKFMSVDIRSLLTIAAIVRDVTNVELFNYCLSVTLLHREETRQLKILSQAECFPEKFIPSQDLANMKLIMDVYRNNPERLVPVEATLVNTGTNIDPEYSLAYFREDIGVNVQYWHWQLVFPFAGDEKLIKKNRRGEFFYYLHHQIMARYNVERFCNELKATERLLDLNENIIDGYFPMLDSKHGSIAWSSRAPNVTLSNVFRADDMIQIDKDDLLRFRQRIFEAIHMNKVFNVDGTTTDINNEQGIDILGNIVEAIPLLSPHLQYYGNLHSFGHLIIGYSQDPHNNYNQPLGVMGSNTTAMRDPIFYRWHALLNDIFKEHKDKLPVYTDQKLKFDNINVTSIRIITSRKYENMLETYMTKDDFDVSKGLDFVRQGQNPGQAFVRLNHLDHDDFEYNIQVNNLTGRVVNGMVRIFMGPIQGPHSTKLTLQQQRSLMIEMDKFVAELIPGKNLIKRKSTESSVTVLSKQTFTTFNRPSTLDSTPDPNITVEQDSFCGCGWPQHMLVPRGTASGFPMILYVMITDYEEDRVDLGVNQVINAPDSCKKNISFYSLRNKLYPDKRPMGFPFDRSIDGNMTTLQEFVGRYSNMQIQPINIFFRSEDLSVAPRGAFRQALTRLDFDLPDSNRDAA